MKGKVLTCIGIVIVGALVAALAIWRFASPRLAAEPEPLPTVAVAPVVRRDLAELLTVQAEFRPYREVELYSKVAGYLKTIDVDFGDRVRAGQTIATLEVPELGAQLDHAIATEQQAEADYRDAHLDYVRLTGVNRSQPNLVAQQDLDTAASRDQSAAAAVAAAKADVNRYQTLIGYTRIVAPFDGVVTRRYADPGALIQAASTSQTQTLPLVRVSENQLLRLDFPISVSYAQEVAIGEPVEVQWAGSAPQITARITRFTRIVDPATRTMETEVEVPNPDLRLIPGMYATVVLKLHQRPDAIAVPLEAVSATETPTVDRVNPDGRIEECPVRLGLQTPGYDEVLAGLQAGDLVVIGSRAGLQAGERITPETIASLALP